MRGVDPTFGTVLAASGTGVGGGWVRGVLRVIGNVDGRVVAGWEMYVVAEAGADGVTSAVGETHAGSSVRWVDGSSFTVGGVKGCAFVGARAGELDWLDGRLAVDSVKNRGRRIWC